MGGPSEETITQLCDMGFERSQVLAALTAAFNNAERAVEYLMTGIPEGALAAQAAGGEGPGAADGEDSGEAGEGPEGEGDGPAPLFNLRNVVGAEGGAGGGDDDFPADSPLAELRRHPQFMQMLALIQQQPQLLGPLMQEIGQNNPAILNLINEHQEEFMQLLQTPVQGAAGENPMAAALAAAGAGGAPGANPNQHMIRVTPEEREAITRLEALGFPRDRVLEAYLACDKNEEIAANYLFDHGNDDEE